MRQTTTERRDGTYGTTKIKRTYEVPDPQPREGLRSIDIGCWFNAKVGSRSGFLGTFEVSIASPSANELRAMAEACNDLADALDQN